MVVPNGVDQQGNRQGMVVSGTDNTHDNNQPAGPDGNGTREQPDTHTTQPDGEGNEGESTPPVAATPTDTAVPPQVVSSEQTSRVFQAPFLAQTAERIFAAPTRRLGDTLVDLDIGVPTRAISVSVGCWKTALSAWRMPTRAAGCSGPVWALDNAFTCGQDAAAPLCCGCATVARSTKTTQNLAHRLI